ncbi:MAG TPA: adenylate/guanylate cyclase domain-containing protein [Kamptonema sp.]|nr:adenylate/guanylate cyclase domain-containing protein [Kamptonema sp.]
MLLKALTRRIFKGSKKMPLRLAMVVPFVLQIFGTVGLTGYVSLRNGQIAVNDVAHQLQIEIGNRIQKNLSDYLAAPRIINQINVNAVKLNQLDLQDARKMTRQFWNQRFLFDSAKVSAIYLGTAEGEFFGIGLQDNKTWQTGRAGKQTNGIFHSYGIDSEGNPTTLLEVRKKYDPRKRPWYQKAVTVGNSVWSEIYLDFKDPRLNITLAQPIYDKVGKVRGVVGVDFILSDIEEFLKTIKIGKTGQTFIIERSGAIVASSTGEKLFVKDKNGEIKDRVQAKNSSTLLIKSTAEYLSNHVGNLASINSNQQFTFEIAGSKHFLQVTPLKDGRGIDWLIIVVVPEVDFMEQIHANTRTTIWLCLGALTLATALGIFTAHWITAPILQLSEATQALANGELNKKVKEKGTRELRILASSFNQMATQLRKTFDALEKTNEILEIRVKERTAALTKSEAQNRAILAAIPDLMIRLTKDGFYVDFLPPKDWESISKLDSNWLGKHISEMLPPDIAELQIQYIERAIATGETQVYEHQFWRSGKLYEEEVRIVVSGINEILLIVRDITERKRLEKELSQTSRFLNSIVENIPLALFVKDVNDNFNYSLWNRAAEEVYAIPRTEVIGRNLYKFMDRETSERVQAEHETIIAGGKLIVVEEIFNSKFKGNIWQRIMKMPLINEQGQVTHLLYIGEDITERKQAEEALRIAQEQSERLLLNILPKTIADQLKQSQNAIAEQFDDATILFADIVGFTPLSARTPPIELVNLLNHIFSQFDELAEMYGLEKIKTIGDAYMVAGGLPVPMEDHANAVAQMALAMQGAIARFQAEKGEPFQIRIGINTGAVVAGVIGIKKFIYDLWGNTVNVASRMESQGMPGRIQVTTTTYERLKDKYLFEERGAIAIKGKGEMNTYWLLGKKVN